MMLSHKFDKDKIKFSGFISRKYDGVPAGYSYNTVVSRQNKTLNGIKWIHDEIYKAIPKNWQIWGEHYKPNMSFKEISGKVRKDEKWKEANLYLFNLNIYNDNIPFNDRYNLLKDWYNKYKFPQLKLCKQIYVSNMNDVDNAILNISNTIDYDNNPIEGYMYHYEYGLYTDNIRSWDSMKIVYKPTIDLQLVDINEAIDKNNNKKGIVGSFICIDSNNNTIIVSAGNFTHKDRKDIFNNFNKYKNKIIVCQYKIDTSYKNNIREPVAKYFHEDKIFPD
jgi:hypothetical protein